ncbi:PTS fructose transporter subunit IIB, partial [Escherichia coli]|nr:PTS fructose transporter subunit IIB [Escherichia coli]
IDGEDRFKGKPVVRVKIGQCVANGEAVLSKVVAAIEARKQEEAN